ncbi:hypothetical protein A4A49_24563 [Nicotiana attenuata]|uniref:Uncharacterized protein n=1 Tax=Nicotiana attenuata TaxID=49451 RepID=A0A1J6K9C0_NICAT|nr:hypothetical protein A4A49_24563 [Nicotiana attenuata]
MPPFPPLVLFFFLSVRSLSSLSPLSPTARRKSPTGSRQLSNPLNSHQSLQIRPNPKPLPPNFSSFLSQISDKPVNSTT